MNGPTIQELPLTKANRIKLAEKLGYTPQGKYQAYYLAA